MARYTMYKADTKSRYHPFDRLTHFLNRLQVSVYLVNYKPITIMYYNYVIIAFSSTHLIHDILGYSKKLSVSMEEYTITNHMELE